MNNYRKISILIIYTVAFSIGFYACQSEQVKEEKTPISTEVLEQKFPNDIDFSQVPYPNISDYGFFVGAMNQMIPNERVLPYEPSSSLFTDHASKSRFVWMPEGVSASIEDNAWQELNFPDKSILIKNFYYPDADGKQKIIETRLLVKTEGKWDAYPYVWNEEQTNAKYKITGVTMPLSFNHEGKQYDINYIVPNKNQCKSCHNIDEEFKPIGPKARNMNFDFDYGNNEVKNQLAKWQEVGFINNFTASENYQAIPNYKHTDVDLNARARAYLDINCAHCHNPRSPASTSGLTLTYEEKDKSKLGYFKTPVAAGSGSGDLIVDLHPGKADSSIIVYRMNTNALGEMMPEIGRTVIDEEGVKLISDWINSL